MAQAIKFTKFTRMVVANKTGQDIRDIDAQLEVSEQMRSAHGDCYYVFDYTTRDGEHVLAALMHQDCFDKDFEFLSEGRDCENRFVPVRTLHSV